MAKLHFYFSAMNAGKTTTLLQSAYNYDERGHQTLIFKPAFDDRDAQGKIASRIGLEAEAILFDENFDFFDYVQGHHVTCVLVDEAQFLNKDQVISLCRIVDELNIPVLTYGLRSDFRGEPFEGSKYLLAYAEVLNEIKTICHCGAKATMNFRVDSSGKPVKDGDIVEIGGNDRYITVCRKHYFADVVSSEEELRKAA